MFDLFPEGGLISMVAQATLAVKIVLGFLAGMSVLSWAIIITKFFTLGRAKRLVSEGYELFLTAEDLGSGLQELSRNSNGPLTNVSTKAVKEYRKLERADIERERKRYLVKDTLDRMLSQGVNAEMKSLSSHISFLATCANAAPFIGLFGTVWGIMDAFHEIGLQQSAALATVAPGISEALVATAIGLAVAIPATIAYNYFRAVLTTLQNEMSNFSGAFLNRVEREVSWAQNKNGKRSEV